MISNTPSNSAGSNPRTPPENARRTPRPGQIYRRILLGTDFSTESAAAFEQALKIARENGSELVIAHAEAMPISRSFMAAAEYDAWAIQSRAEATRQIEYLVARARKEGVRCHALVLFGGEDDALVEAARKLRVDLIVLGERRRRGLSTLLGGSVSAHVCSRAPCSVLSVRERRH